MKIILRKQDTCLIAEDSISMDLLAKIKDNDFVTCEIRRSRSVKFHRLFFKLLDVVYEAQEEPRQFSTIDNMLDGLKMSMGHMDEIHDCEGRHFFKPSSISFSNMDADEFRQFFDRAVDTIIKYILPNSTKEGLEAEVFSLLGLPMI